VWTAYQNEAQDHDKPIADGWNGDMDVLLVFVSSLVMTLGHLLMILQAGLFSAILTAFIIEFYKQLQLGSCMSSASTQVWQVWCAWFFTSNPYSQVSKPVSTKKCEYKYWFW
jgi:hypothetical protein